MPITEVDNTGLKGQSRGRTVDGENHVWCKNGHQLDGTDQWRFRVTPSWSSWECGQCTKEKNNRSTRKFNGLVATRPTPKTCEVCAREFGEGVREGAFLDHEHVTGKTRGWLCNRCNVMLGMAGDDPETLRLGAEYIERWART